MKKHKIIFALIILSILLNVYFIFFPKKLYVAKNIEWLSDSISVKGFLEPVNYEAPKDWNTIYLIDVLNTSNTGSTIFIAREVVVTNGVLISLGAEEYSVVEINDNRIVAEDDVYRFELTKDEVLITDKHGKVSRLSNGHGINF
jgi:hypothetical protein